MRIYLFWLCAFHGYYANALDLEYVREQYGKAAADKKTCKTMIMELSSCTESDEHLAYLGAFQAMWANHISNPFSKLNTFKEGKRNIEKAVEQSRFNPELRFIRLSVQKNCPGFLGYHDNIIQDRQFLCKHRNMIKSAVLLKMVNELLNGQ